jgi:indole-3-glycerol phosphate synthase
VLRKDYDPAAIAAGYEANGAAAISVLTEPSFFDGALDHLAVVRARVSVPLLRKDFIVTEYQLVEAAAAGADAALLIVAALDDEPLARLLAAAKVMGLAALVEVHDRTELKRAIGAGAAVIGVNSRNLRTLHVDTAVLDDLGTTHPARYDRHCGERVEDIRDLIRLRQAAIARFSLASGSWSEPDPGLALGRMRDEWSGRGAPDRAAGQDLRYHASRGRRDRRGSGCRCHWIRLLAAQPAGRVP